MRLVKITALTVALGSAGAAHAAGVGLRAGTTGLGADIGWSVAPLVSARLGYSAYDHNTSVNTSDVHYDGKLKLRNLSALLDFTPVPGTFRLTAGIVGDNNKYDLTGQPTGGTFTLNGTTYQASQVGSLTGNVKPARSAAPYLGVGWGNVAGAGVNFYADLGIMFQGSPKASLTATCGSGLSAGQCAQLQSDTAAQQQQLQDKLKNFKYYPVANIGVTIGF